MKTLIVSKAFPLISKKNPLLKHFPLTVYRKSLYTYEVTKGFPLTSTADSRNSATELCRK